MAPMLVLGNNELTGLLLPQQITDAVETALRAQVANELVMPPRLRMDCGANTFLTMPASGPGGFGVKIACVIPDNAVRGLPVTSGVMLLINGETGAPLALMAAASLTAQRTGALGAIGVKFITPESTDSAGLVGCGMQGAWQAIFACAVRPIRRLFCVSRSTSSYERFRAIVDRHISGVRFTRCENVREMLTRTDLVIAATNSSEPVLPDEPGLLANKHFISVGSFKPSMQELPDAVYDLAGLVAVDSEHALHEVGDLLNPLRHGVIKESDVFSIAECVTGQRSISTAHTTVYKCVGAANFDLYVAHALLRSATSRGIGLEVAL
jgi:ornithine cyclodeaminase/alanine dehydrogenase-like protein (mu-crystallin family)